LAQPRAHAQPACPGVCFAVCRATLVHPLRTVPRVRNAASAARVPEGGFLCRHFPLGLAGWFMTLFSSMDILPYEHTCYVWDLFFVDGWKVLFRVALALLRYGRAPSAVRGRRTRRERWRGGGGGKAGPIKTCQPVPRQSRALRRDGHVTLNPRTLRGPWVWWWATRLPQGGPSRASCIRCSFGTLHCWLYLLHCCHMDVWPVNAAVRICRIHSFLHPPPHPPTPAPPAWWRTSSCTRTLRSSSGFSTPSPGTACPPCPSCCVWPGRSRSPTASCSPWRSTTPAAWLRARGSPAGVGLEGTPPLALTSPCRTTSRTCSRGGPRRAPLEVRLGPWAWFGDGEGGGGGKGLSAGCGGAEQGLLPRRIHVGWGALPTPMPGLTPPLCPMCVLTAGTFAASTPKVEGGGSGAGGKGLRGVFNRFVKKA
jgi:hypothetical protein